MLLQAKLAQALFKTGSRMFGLQEHWFSDIDIDSPTAEIMARGSELARMEDRPGGIICSAAIPAIAMSAGLIKAGIRIGQDIDVVTKQSTQLMELLRPEIIFIHEDFRAAGLDLAHSVMAWIGGAEPAGLQVVVGPKPRTSLLT